MIVKLVFRGCMINKSLMDTRSQDAKFGQKVFCLGSANGYRVWDVKNWTLTQEVDITCGMSPGFT